MLRSLTRLHLGRLARRTMMAGGVLVMAAGGGMVTDGWYAFGTTPTGDRRDRMERSPQWNDGRFNNPQPLWNDWWGMITGLAGASTHGRPHEAVPVVHLDPEDLLEPPPTGLRVTWFGHSSLLVELDGHRILTDPVWGPRASPFDWVGPERWYEPPLTLDQLPPLDAVILSHDHYDHLDYPTMAALRTKDTRFVAPLGVGAHLEYWGIPADRIVELDWWDRTRIESLDIVCVPARHASGRTGLDKDRTLWAGYALIGDTHRVYFSGDTGLFPAMREIGNRFGPFDLTMIETGAYNQAWPDWHLGPEQAVRAHEMVQGKALLPIHWGLFNLAYHSWTEPMERTLAAADARNVLVLTPRPGESLEPALAPPPSRWWPSDTPWVRGEDDPVVATMVD